MPISDRELELGRAVEQARAEEEALGAERNKQARLATDDLLRAAYGASSPPTTAAEWADKRDADQAAAFVWNSDMEFLRTQADAGATISPNLRLALGYYLEGRAAAARRGTLAEARRRAEESRR